MSLFLALALAAAQDDPLQPGIWRFETHDRTAGRPVCTEQWELRADGTMTVRGGEEVVEKRYRFRHDRDGDWIVATTIATNGKPDCMGTVTANPRTDEHSIYVIPFNDGSVEVCPPPGRASDGNPVTVSCYATLTRMDAKP